MSQEAEAAETVIRYTQGGVEKALKISGWCAYRTAHLIIRLLKSSDTRVIKKEYSRLNEMVLSGRELCTFTVADKDLRSFMAEARKYSVPYTLVRDTADGRGFTSFVVYREDMGRVNRIIKRLNLSLPPAVPGDTGKKPGKEEKAVKKETDMYLNAMRPDRKPGPEAGRADGFPPSEPSSETHRTARRPPVREAINKFREDEELEKERFLSSLPERRRKEALNDRT